MSEKVKLTQEQADWIEKYTLTQEQVDYMIDIQPHRKRPDSPIVDWSVSKLAKALYTGYEVEPEYGIDCWVLYENEQCQDVVTKIIDIQYGNNRVQFDSISDWQHIKSIQRHATPEEIAKEKERRWWAKHGREPWELKEDDVLTRNDDGFPWFVGKKRDSLPGYYLDGEHFNLEDIRNNYRVIVFVHDRKDVDHE